MFVEWTLHVPVTPSLLSDMQLAADCARVAEGVHVPLSAHVTVTDDAEIHALNAAHRGVDRATDVLSFPSIRYAAGRRAHNSPKRLRAAFDPDAEGAMLGDVVISLQRARAQAAEYGHTDRREMAFLLTHALFHLMGYDHIEENDAKEMRGMEKNALQMAGISRGAEGAPDAPASDDTLVALAREASERAYAPYSRFRVGACLRAADGRLFQGCNVENASFGVTNCAERTAVFKAVSEGAREFNTIAIYAESAAPWPCGLCRQVLNEFAPDLRVIASWGGAGADGLPAFREEAPLSALLPHGFGPKELTPTGAAKKE